MSPQGPKAHISVTCEKNFLVFEIRNTLSCMSSIMAAADSTASRNDDMIIDLHCAHGFNLFKLCKVIIQGIFYEVPHY